MKHHFKFSVAVPASLVSDVPHLREKSFKIGLIGRAAAIFRVDQIVVFPDLSAADQNRDAGLISVILSYMETPQYLRKRLFRIRPELRYAGILPPLRTPHHPLADKIRDLHVGEYREGVIVSFVRDGSLVDVGVERPLLVPDKKLQIANRVTVKITELGRRPRVALVNRNEIEEYWGYRVAITDSPFGRLVKKGSFDLVVATSRFGVPVMDIEEELAERWSESRRILVAFGAPTEGLHEIVARENLKLADVADFVVNMIPDQGTETVRTEEAVYASLALLNCLVKARG